MRWKRRPGAVSETDPHRLADRMIVVARHERKHAPAARQLEGVKELGAAECLVQHAREQRAGVIVAGVVGAQQALHGRAAGEAVNHMTRQRAELEPDRVLVYDCAWK